TSSGLIFVSPIIPKMGNIGAGMSLSSPASFASLLFTSDKGAPVSKMSLYGPLPFALTITAMCPERRSSNGTVTGLACLAEGTSAGRRDTKRTITVAAISIVRMSDALPALEGDVLALGAALDRQLDLGAGGQLVREANHVSNVGDAAPLDVGDDVALL